MKLSLTILRYVIVLAVVAGIIGGIFYVKSIQLAPQDPPAFPPEAVTTEKVEQREWPQFLRAVGEVRQRTGVKVSTELGGIITKIAFESGQKVTQGDILIELDRSNELANIRSAQATLRLAEINLKRTRELLAERAISESEFDTAEATADEAKARVEALQATIAKKTIRAPFTGRLGIRQVNLGQYLNPGTEIVDIQDLSTVYAYFSLPQRYLAQVQEGQRVELSTDAYPDDSFVGELFAIEPSVSRAARQIEMLGVFQNADERLRPGMYAEVKVIMPEPKTVVAVPRPAVYYQSYGNTIFVVKPAEEGEGLVVEERMVRLGQSRGDYVEVLNDLEAGETVATSAVFKLSDGRAVMEQNQMALNFSETPSPEDS